MPPKAANESDEEWVSRIDADDRERTVEHLFGVLKSESEDYSAEYRIVRPNDGTMRWIRVVAKIERDRDGRALRLVGADRDVTAQALAQATLRESEERFRLIADSAPVPVWVTSLTARVPSPTRPISISWGCRSRKPSFSTGASGCIRTKRSDDEEEQREDDVPVGRREDGGKARSVVDVTPRFKVLRHHRRSPGNPGSLLMRSDRGRPRCCADR